MPEGEGRMTSSFSAAGGGFGAAFLHPQTVFDTFLAPPYASSQWLERIIVMKLAPGPAQPKSKFFGQFRHM
jgi:hypothetical protein